MSKSANQLFKESKSDLSFKEWLQIEQEEGRLQVSMANADGDKEVIQTTKKAKVSLGKWNVVGVVAVGLLIYGLMQVSKKE
jgi:hypothetical protein